MNFPIDFKIYARLIGGVLISSSLPGLKPNE